MDSGTGGGGLRLTVPRFDGTQSEFLTWWMQFSAFATVGRFGEAIGTTQEVDLPATEATALSADPDIAKRQKAAKWRNNMAIAQLTLAFSKGTLMNIILNAGTTDWPRGLAWNVIKKLYERFNPKDPMTRVEIRASLSNLRMRSNDDPAQLFEQIHTIP